MKNNYIVYCLRMQKKIWLNYLIKASFKIETWIESQEEKVKRRIGSY